MTVKSSAAALAAAIAGLLGLTAGALADPGVATAAANVHTSPGAQVVGSLHVGEAVDVVECREGWCFVTRPAGVDGWVQSGLLSIDPPSGGTGSGTGLGIDLGNGFGISIGGEGGPSISFSIGGQQQPPAQPDPPATPAPTGGEACFFSQPGFTGTGFCIPRGAQQPNLTAPWNTGIASIRVTGGVMAYLCEQPSFSPQGACFGYDQDAWDARPTLSRPIHSIRVE